MPEVDSTCLSAISYDPRTRNLTVIFRQSGRSYTYHSVPEAVYRELLYAGSKGRFYNALIKHSYSYS